ncbi:NAD(P)-binding domain-containing protein [Streptacidiphilus sp. ASG 303]|uniref:NADPH-dependent F420 reductase n=1 Tax=Streptacidiphilus sp. ASG 303 TaxID=2896847 RepID=UPI001E312001|nr:NAD(P)-binding domain-containing protein [Streptacidiphilus sp. ASG 303]MCD0486469.1 NAD(P)-binding domain-containing protein [Streptacidiphilus sp. ASG 303]
MRYAVLGTGVVGRTVAAKLASLGHEVVVGTRDPQATLARTEPDAMGTPPFAQWHQGNPGVRLASFADAAATADAVVNATSGAGALDALALAGAENLAGKVLLDIANPLDFSQGMPPSLDPVNTDSLGEQIQRAFPEARVVKTLNTMNSSVMVDPARVAGEHHVFVSGDDADAKKAAAELLASFGWPAGSVIDLGDITTARGTEMLLPIWLRLWGALGHADFNFHIQGARAGA